MTHYRKIIDCNVSTTRHLGQSKKEIQGCVCSTLFHKSVCAHENCPLLRAQRSLRRESIVFQENGRRYKAVVDPVLGRDNELISAVHVIRDITEESLGRDVVAKSERRLREIINSSETGYVVSKGARVIFANKRLAEMLGYDSAEEFEKIPLTRHVHGSDMERVCEALEKWERGKRDESALETKAICRRGMLKTLKIEWKEYEHDGEKCVISSVRDISLEKELEDMKRKVHKYQSQSMLGRVAGRVAHDFNNIMGITLGMSQMMLVSDDLSPDMKYYAQSIKETSARGREITRNLVFFAGNPELRLARYNLKKKLALVVESMKRELNGIKIFVECGDDVDDVIGDRILMSEALTQLVRNSIHAVGKTADPVIAIGAVREHGGISIMVGDNGCGIPKEYHEDVFEPTFTLKGSQDHIRAYREDIKGSGYGLSNAKKCVDMHRGSISFSSERGEGAIFRLWIPDFDIEPKQTEMDGNGEAMELSAFAGKSILVVEDEVHFANLLCRTLVNQKNHVDIVTDGRSALEHMAKKKYDAISLDCVLPDTNGIEIYSKIREMDKNIPIIFVSGTVEYLEMIMAIREKDFNVSHLSKPFDNLEYIHALNRVMATR